MHRYRGKSSGFGGDSPFGNTHFFDHVRARTIATTGQTPVFSCFQGLERVKGIEPKSEAWEAHVPPLNHTRPRERIPVGRSTRRSEVPRFRGRTALVLSDRLKAGLRTGGQSEGFHVQNARMFGSSGIARRIFLDVLCPWGDRSAAPTAVAVAIPAPRAGDPWHRRRRASPGDGHGGPRTTPLGPSPTALDAVIPQARTS